MYKKVIDEIVANFSSEQQVESIAIGGSKSQQISDEFSDIDVYVYSNYPVDLNVRKKVAEKFAKRLEINNQFWETGDEWIVDEIGLAIDITFRDPQWIEGEHKKVLELHQASLGYTTCVWFNVLNSKIVFDRNQWFLSQQQKSNISYPEQLKMNIIKKNYPVLKQTISSYAKQIEKAAKRNDWVSINHRLAAYLASYFDIIFAINELPHPGEKRLVEYCMETCKKLPHNFEHDLPRISNSFNMRMFYKISDSLEELLEWEGLM